MKGIVFLFLCLILFLGNHFFTLYKDSGAAYQAPNIAPGLCQTIETVLGPEDFALGKMNLYISSNDNRMIGKQKEYENGNIYILNLVDGAIEVMKHDYMDKLHPHGIAYLESAGREYLFVINHKIKEDSIILFEIKGNQLSFQREIIDELLVNANDIAPLDLDTFYVTRDHHYKTHLGKFLENLSRIGMGSLMYFDGEDFSIVKKGLKFANGLDIDRRLKRLYMAEMLGKKVYSFDISNNKNLKVLKTVDLPGAPDNIYLADPNTLYVATHNKVLDLKKHQLSKEDLAPSSIYRVKMNKKDNPQLIYSNDGKKLSAASIAIPYNKKIYIGTIFDKKLLVCDDGKN